MDRVPEGEGIEPMLTVLETHIYQVITFKKIVGWQVFYFYNMLKDKSNGT